MSEDAEDTRKAMCRPETPHRMHGRIAPEPEGLLEDSQPGGLLLPDAMAGVKDGMIGSRR